MAVVFAILMLPFNAFQTIHSPGARSSRSLVELLTLNVSTNQSNSSVFSLSSSSLPPVSSSFGYWPTYAQNAQRTGSQSLEQTLSPTNASQLQRLFSVPTNGSVEGSIAVMNSSNGTGRAYFGTWGGNAYSVDAATGATSWISYLKWAGNHVIPNCHLPSDYPVAGITSTPAISGNSEFLAARNRLYDMNANTGKVNWNIDLANVTPYGGGGSWWAHYIWSSPLVFNNYVYIGMASGCDNPLVEGQLDQVNISTRIVDHHFNVVPVNQSGGSIWSTPSLDRSTNTVWVSTGNPAGNGTTNFGQAIVALNASDISKVRGYYLNPSGCKGGDCDFGAGPTMFSASNNTGMVGALSKDGIFYAFYRSSFVRSGGGITKVTAPAWVATTGNYSEIAPAAFNGNTIYLGGGNYQNTTVPGTVQAVDPSTGHPLWQHTSPGFVRAGLTSANGLVIDVADWTNKSTHLNESALEVLNAATGSLIYFYNTTPSSQLWMNAEPVVFDGRIFVGVGPSSFSGQGGIYVFGIPDSAKPSNLRPYDTSPFGGNIYGFGNATGGMPTYNFTWSWGDGSAASYGKNPSHIYFGNGRFIATLNVTDAGGTVAAKSWSIYNQVYNCGTGFGWCWVTTSVPCYTIVTCFPNNFPVQAMTMGAYLSGSVGSVTWDWNFGDGTADSSSQNPIHTYASHGTYTVTVTATDSENHRAVASIIVTV